MRRLALGLVTAVVVLAGVELVAFFGLRWVSDVWLGHASLESERVARAAGVVGGADPEEIAQRRDAAVKRALHPYLGWVQDADEPDPIPFGDTNPEARELGFPNNRASPFQEPSPDRLVVAVLGGSGRSSRQMHALASAHGAEYHHFLQPNQCLPGSKVLTAREREKAFRPGTRRDELIRSGYPLLQREGARLAGEGVPFHDLTGIFDGVEGPIYVDICCHLNKAGNRLIADAIARALGEPGGA